MYKACSSMKANPTQLIIYFGFYRWIKLGVVSIGEQLQII